MVHEGRTVEMKFFDGMRVYDRVPRSEQQETGGKIIGTKWIDVNKGNIDHPNIRCRLVGKEFRTTPDDALYASMPPLEALRMVVSRAATLDGNGQEREIMINDVSRAYFYAEATRCKYIELPKEDPKADPNMLWRLRLCLYGTRDAALNWQQTLSDHLEQAGFKRGVGHPSVFFQPHQGHMDTSTWRSLLQRRIEQVIGLDGRPPRQEVRDQDPEDWRRKGEERWKQED